MFGYNNYTNPYLQANSYLSNTMVQPQPIRQMNQPQTQYEVPFNDVRFVNEKEAQGFILLPNQKALLMDTANKKFWIKYTDGLGNSSTETYRFEKIENGDSNVTIVEEKPAIDTSAFITKDDFKNVATKTELNSLKETIAELKKQIKINQILSEKPNISTKVE